MPTQKSQESILINDGEGVEHNDINNIQRLFERRMVDYFAGGTLIQPGDMGQIIRPLGDALSIGVAAGIPSFDIQIRAGVVFGENNPAPADPEPYQIMHRMPSSIDMSITPAHATLARVDVLSAKLEYDAIDTGGPDGENRDFQDAVTRALSTTTVDKRRRTLLTVTLTEGTPGSGEPAGPAGEVVFARLNIPALAGGVTSDNVVDRRTPAGYSTVFYPNSLWGGIPATGGWALAAGAAGPWSAVGPGDLLNLMLTAPARHDSDGEGTLAAFENPFNNKRLASLRLAYNLDHAAGATFKLRHQNGYTAAGKADLLDLTSQLGTTATNQTTLFSFNSDIPIWMNGLLNPRNVATFPRGQLLAEARSQVPGDRIFGLWAGWWG